MFPVSGRQLSEQRNPRTSSSRNAETLRGNLSCLFDFPAIERFAVVFAQPACK
jgi:hypothetical protein